MIVGTAGHVDHGKTALVHALTGVDTDRLPEEKRRGITIELGFAPLSLAGLGRVGVVDVPGHEAFVRTMLAGATGIDIALIVIAADEGVMPQTREHLAILSLLGVGQAVVALTKSDLAEPQWIDLVESDVRAMLAATPFAQAEVVRCSATTGAGIAALRAELAAAALRVPHRAAGDYFRMPVDRAFTVKGTGTVVTGTVWAGQLETDATVTLLPRGIDARVRRIEMHGVESPEATSGERTAIALAGVERDAIDVRGTWLVRAGDPWVASNVLRADVALLDGSPSLGPRTRVRLHLGTADVGARIVGAGGPVTPGTRRSVRIVLDAPVVARSGDRFVLRRASPSETIGGGMVTDSSPPRHRAKPWPQPGADAVTRLSWVVREAGGRGASTAGLAVRVGVRPTEIGALVESARGVRRVGGLLFAEEVIVGARDQCLALINRAHNDRPLESGVPVQALRSAISVSPNVVDAALAELAAAGAVTVSAGLAASAGWAPGGNPEGRRRSDALLAAVMTAGKQPPSVDELTKVYGRDTLSALRLLAGSGDIVQVAPDRFFSRESVAEVKATVLAALSGGTSLTTSELREKTGLTRKYVIPLLEYFDRLGVTVRAEDRRRAGTANPSVPGR